MQLLGTLTQWHWMSVNTKLPFQKLIEEISSLNCDTVCQTYFSMQEDMHRSEEVYRGLFCEAMSLNWIYLDLCITTYWGQVMYDITPTVCMEVGRPSWERILFSKNGLAWLHHIIFIYSNSRKRLLQHRKNVFILNCYISNELQHCSGL